MAARVVRVWKGYVTADGVQRCCGNHFANTVLPQLGALEGFLSAKVLVRSSDDETEVVVATVWDSIDSVKAFAGEDESEQNQGKGLTGELATCAMMARCLSLPRPLSPWCTSFVSCYAASAC